MIMCITIYSSYLCEDLVLLRTQGLPFFVETFMDLTFLLGIFEKLAIDRLVHFYFYSINIIERFLDPLV